MDSNFPQNSNDTSKTAEPESPTMRRRNNKKWEIEFLLEWCTARINAGDSIEEATEAYLTMFPETYL